MIQRRNNHKRKINIYKLGIAIAILIAIIIAAILLFSGDGERPSPLSPLTFGRINPVKSAAKSRIVFDDPVPDNIRSELKSAEIPKTFEFSKDDEILIYHTHTTEAYAQDPSHPYESTDEFHTKDQSQNVVAIGELLCDELKKRGLNVRHDTTDYQTDKKNTSYERALDSLLTQTKDDPAIKLLIDIHRDSYDAENDIHSVAGLECAKMLFVVGTGYDRDGKAFDTVPDYLTNFKFAMRVSENLTGDASKLSRGVMVKRDRYNQYHTNFALLIESGYTGNSLQQVKNSIPYLADAIANSIEKTD